MVARTNPTSPTKTKKPPNRLFHGDNLDVLRRHVGPESVDLIYLDPPFKSDQDYNVLFAERSGDRAAAQIKAFEDTWRWDRSAEEAYSEALAGGGRVADMMANLRGILGESDMMAYLSMMAPRLVELRRVLKPTGSIYLHCDPTASHYLKLLMDSVFGPQRFLNEIVWERTNAHNMKTRGYARVNDVILFYSKERDFKWNGAFMEYGAAQLGRYREDENGRLYKAENLTFSTVNPGRQFEWRGATPPAHRSWGASKEQLEKWFAEGRILVRKDGVPRLDGLKVYLDEMKGKPCTTNWSDIPRIGNTSGERLGYPTQKPEALLERIIRASSDEGDVVLDPFCGCGTAISVAQRLGRRWIGIDITHLAIGLIKHRLHDAFGTRAKYQVLGEPAGLPDARTLALADRFQFQWWALGRVGARPAEQKKGADRGIDGRIYFQDTATGKPGQAILSVKSGAVGVRDVRDLRGVIEREDAAIGVLLTLEEPTRPMRADAAAAGFYASPGWNRKYPRLQILTIEEILAGKEIEMPPANTTFKKARATVADADPPHFLESGESE